MITDRDFKRIDLDSSNEHLNSSLLALWVNLVTVIIRDILAMVCELIAGLILATLMTDFWRRRCRLKGSCRPNQRKNARISLALCSISVLLHAVIFLTFITMLYDSTPGHTFYCVIGIVNVFLIQLKHVANLFIFHNLIKNILVNSQALWIYQNTGFNFFSDTLCNRVSEVSGIKSSNWNWKNNEKYILFGGVQIQRWKHILFTFLGSIFYFSKKKAQYQKFYFLIPRGKFGIYAFIWNS